MLSCVTLILIFLWSRIQLTAALNVFKWCGLAAFPLLFYELPCQVKVISVNEAVMVLAAFGL